MSGGTMGSRLVGDAEMTRANDTVVEKRLSWQAESHPGRDMWAKESGQLKSAKGPARNAPCPCGSGAKFKRCCSRGGQ